MVRKPKESRNGDCDKKNVNVSEIDVDLASKRNSFHLLRNQLFIGMKALNVLN
jgi:hypothetical protein